MTRSGSVLDEAVARASVTHAAVVDRGALAGLPQLLLGLGLKGPFQIVADSNTMAAAGHATLAVLREAGLKAHEPLVLAERPRLKPRTETAREVAAALKQGGAFPLAVGSGVINDITKYAAEVAGVSYVSIATAASMDGYAASGGAMLT
jgi:glycerol-1-phosphate dehydrogenase [NAD(P)+]